MRNRQDQDFHPATHLSFLSLKRNKNYSYSIQGVTAKSVAPLFMVATLRCVQARQASRWRETWLDGHWRMCYRAEVDGWATDGQCLGLPSQDE